MNTEQITAEQARAMVERSTGADTFIEVINEFIAISAERGFDYIELWPLNKMGYAASDEIREKLYEHYTTLGFKFSKFCDNKLESTIKDKTYASKFANYLFW